MSQLNREYLTTQNLYILHPYRKESIYGKTCQIYGSISHPMLRISHYRERWPIISTHVSHVDFRLPDYECGRTCSTQHFKGITRSRTRTALVFQRKLKNTKRSTENTLHRRKSRWWTLVSWYSSSRIRCIQIAHIAFRTCFGNLWTAREKYAIGSADKIHKGKNNKQESTQANISLLRKVRVSQWPAPIKLLVLLSSPSCRPLLLSLLRRTHELLANSGLLWSSSSFCLVVVYPDVWLMKQSTLLLRACEIWIQKLIYTGFKRGSPCSGFLRPHTDRGRLWRRSGFLWPRIDRGASRRWIALWRWAILPDVPLSHHRAALSFQRWLGRLTPRRIEPSHTV